MNSPTEINTFFSPKYQNNSENESELCEHFTFHKVCKNGSNCTKIHKKNVCLFYYQFGICKLDNKCKGGHQFTKNEYTKNKFEKFQLNWAHLNNGDKLSIVWTIQMIKEIGSKLCLKCFLKKTNLMNDKKNYFSPIFELLYKIVSDGLCEKIGIKVFFYFLSKQNIPLMERVSFLYMEKCILHILTNYNDVLIGKEKLLPDYLLNELKTNQCTVNHTIYCIMENDVEIDDSYQQEII